MSVAVVMVAPGMVPGGARRRPTMAARHLAQQLVAELELERDQSFLIFALHR
jgi:hypothetical protein